VRQATRAGELYARALEAIPGGVDSPVRAMKAVGLDEPLFARRGEGAYLEDADGRRYVDWVLSWGPLLFGHADPETVEAVTAAAREGTTFGAATEREVELAEEICRAVPSVERVRLVSSGTEAAMSALRLARASDTARYGELVRGLLGRGVYTPPSQFEALFISLAHRDEEIDFTLEAIAELSG
jgi:glutamate-1-semialdehyde 2,1-aminomutase